MFNDLGILIEITLYATYPSLTKAIAALNPSGFNSLPGRRIKAERLMNRQASVEMELGFFYVMRNPNSPNPFLVNQMGKFTHFVEDLSTGLVGAQSGLKPAIR